MGKRDEQEKSAMLGNGEGLKISCMCVSRVHTYHALRYEHTSYREHESRMRRRRW